MPVERKYFGQGGLNADDADFAVPESDYINLEGFRFGSTDNGATGRLESVGGTDLIFDSLPSGTNINVGSVEDEARQRIIFFNWNSNGNHGIYAFDKPSSTTYTVLTNAQVENGFGFNQYAYIHSARVIGDLLYWTDDLNEPRKINIESGIKLNDSGYSTDATAYETPIPATSITVIKKPPIKPLTVEKVVSGTATSNLIRDVAMLFTYQYRFRDNETSALASYSKLMPFNSNAEAADAVQITVPLTEIIDNDVIAVDVCVQYGNAGTPVIIHSWDKESEDDLSAIIEHNSGTTALTYTFLNDAIGLGLGTTPRSFDYVPRLSSALEVARNRLFLGNNLQGYNTPKKSSLEAELVNTDTGSSGSYDGQWGYVTLHANYTGCSGVQDSFMFPFVQSSTAPNQLYYFSAVRSGSIWNGGLGTVPSTININTASFHGDTIDALVAYLKATNYPSSSGGCSIGSPPWQTTYEANYNSLGTVTMYAYSSVQVNQFFKSSSTYSLSIAFYDKYRRKCGVVKTNAKVFTPARTYSQSSFTTGIEWTLDNTDAVNELPEWAHYYQIHITKNLSMTGFMQARARNATYITQDADGAYVYSTSAYATTAYGVALDITALNSYGIGYTFAEGDICSVMYGSSKEDMRVTGVNGKWIHLELRNLSTLNSSSEILFEIYTPYRKSVNEFYYETGDVMDVNDPGTVDRAYSVINGTVNGDCYALERTADGSNYIVEAMSPNDRFWSEWERDFGWPNQIDHIGEQRKIDNILFSNIFLPNTKTNGLSTFEVLNQDDISHENGEIEKLMLVDKTQEDGSVLLVIGRNRTSSLYLGESRITDNTGATQFFAKDSGVIGTINTLRGDYGTINPESVFELQGEVFWYDANHSAFVQYSNNGLFPISSRKNARPTKLFSEKYLSYSQADLEARGNRPFVFGGGDPYHGECLWSIPRVDEIENLGGYLPGYEEAEEISAAIEYPYDFYDGQGKTWVYRPAARDKWIGSYPFNAEGFCTIGADMYSFSSGKLYKHNSTTYFVKFYGVNKTARLMWLSNAMPGVLKKYTGIFIESSEAPAATIFYANNPNEQVSDLATSDYNNREGIFYSPILRDRLSPNISGNNDAKLIKGDPMKTAALKAMVSFSQNSRQVYINFVSTEYILSKGHKNVPA